MQELSLLVSQSSHARFIWHFFFLLRTLATTPEFPLSNKYKDERLIGSGGFGAVWSARSLARGEEVAIKFFLGRSSDKKYLTWNEELISGTSRDRETRQKVLSASSECDVTQELFQGVNTQEHVVRCLENHATARGAVEGEPIYLVLELAGEPLLDFMTRKRDQGLWSLSLALEIEQQLFRGINFLSRRGFVHGDIKPPNVAVKESDEKPFIRIIDMGSCRAFAKLDDSDEWSAFSLPPLEIPAKNYAMYLGDAYNSPYYHGYPSGQVVPPYWSFDMFGGLATVLDLLASRADKYLGDFWTPTISYLHTRVEYEVRRVIIGKDFANSPDDFFKTRQYALWAQSLSNNEVLMTQCGHYLNSSCTNAQTYPNDYNAECGACSHSDSITPCREVCKASLASGEGKFLKLHMEALANIAIAENFHDKKGLLRVVCWELKSAGEAPYTRENGFGVTERKSLERMSNCSETIHEGNLPVLHEYFNHLESTGRLPVLLQMLQPDSRRLPPDVYLRLLGKSPEVPDEGGNCFSYKKSEVACSGVYCRCKCPKNSVLRSQSKQSSASSFGSVCIQGKLVPSPQDCTGLAPAGTSIIVYAFAVLGSIVFALLLMYLAWFVYSKKQIPTSSESPSIELVPQ